tara:strand:+ start:6210 stop:6707 length:498 start_codon:yes stop_codon:yes gene_type:complete
MSQNDSIIEYSENDAIILDKSFSDKLSNVIMQKDTLISSLKDTINNLTNIIVNYTHKIESLNKGINIEVQDINKEASKLDYYIENNNNLKNLLQTKNSQIEILSKEVLDFKSLYNNLNDCYISNLNKNQLMIDHLNIRISTLKTYIETLKTNHYHKIDNIRNELQ